MNSDNPNWETCTKESINAIAPALKELRLRGSWLFHPESSSFQPKIVGDVDYYVSFEEKEVFLYIIITCENKTYYDRIHLGWAWEKNGDYRIHYPLATEDIVAQALGIKCKFEKERVPALTSPIRFLFTPWAIIALLVGFQIFLSMHY